MYVTLSASIPNAASAANSMLRHTKSRWSPARQAIAAFNQMVSVAPIGKKTYKYKQSPSEFLPALSARIIISGPSSSGKGVLCANLLLNPKTLSRVF